MMHDEPILFTPPAGDMRQARRLFKGGGKGQKSAPAPVITPATPAPPPVVEDAQVKAENDADAMRRRRGAASNILSGGTDLGGAGNSPSVGTKQLLGN